MKETFADTSHFVAVLHPSDQLHEKAVSVGKSLIENRLITIDFVLTEVLNYFSEFREYYKARIARAVELIISESKIQIVECSREEFLKGFEFYNSRLDKGYSLTDCVSMNLMRERNISEILTNDDHFKQEGFRILLLKLWVGRLIIFKNLKMAKQFHFVRAEILCKVKSSRDSFALLSRFQILKVCKKATLFCAK